MQCCKAPRKQTTSIAALKKQHRSGNSKQVDRSYNPYKRLMAKPAKLLGGALGLRNSPCPSYLVLLELEINGRLIKRCRKSII